MIITLTSIKVLAASFCVQMGLAACPRVVDAQDDPHAHPSSLAYYSEDRNVVGFDIQAMQEQGLQAREVKLLTVHELAHARHKSNPHSELSHHGAEWTEIYHRYRDL